MTDNHLINTGLNTVRLSSVYYSITPNKFVRHMYVSGHYSWGEYVTHYLFSCILWQKPWGGGWASITGGLVGQRTAPPLLLLLLSFNNCFSMSNFVLATKRYLI